MLPTFREKMNSMYRLPEFYQAKVDEAKRTGNLTEIIALLVEIKADCETVAKELKSPLEKIKSALAYNIVPEMFNEADLKTQTYDELGVRVTVSSNLTVSTLDKEKALEWGKKEGITQETINSSTLKAYAKELMKENRELPDDIFKTEATLNTSITKVR